MDAADNDLLCTIAAQVSLDNGCYRRGQQGFEDDLPCASLAHLQLQGADIKSCHLICSEGSCPLHKKHGNAAINCSVSKERFLQP